MSLLKADSKKAEFFVSSGPVYNAAVSFFQEALFLKDGEFRRAADAAVLDSELRTRAAVLYGERNVLQEILKLLDTLRRDFNGKN